MNNNALNKDIPGQTTGNGVMIMTGVLYFLIAALTPVGTMLASDITLDSRGIALISITALVAGVTSLKAFLSTTFSDSAASDSGQPKAVVIEQPESKPVPVSEQPPTL